MSDNAAELMKQLRDGKTSADSKPQVAVISGDQDRFYARLIVLKLRRQQLVFAMIASFIVFAILIARDYGKGHPWWLVGLPIGIIGLLIAAIPVSEEWEYKPWQARARQYERNQINH